MNRVFAYRVFAFIACSLCLHSLTANAISVVSSQHGVVFYDDFETGVVGAVPNNGAEPGNWGTSASGVTVIYDAAPGAFQGNKYLKVDRVTSFADAFLYFPTTPVQEGTIHTEMMLNIPASNEGPLEFVATTVLGYGGAFPQTWVTDAFAQNGLVTYYNHGLGQTLETGVTYLPGEWQKWELDHDLASSTYVITVDGVSSSPLPFIDPVSDGEGIQSITLRSGNNNTVFYVDAVNVVPEPSSLAISLLGAVGLWAVRRRHSVS